MQITKDDNKNSLTNYLNTAHRVAKDKERNILVPCRLGRLTNQPNIENPIKSSSGQNFQKNEGNMEMINKEIK
jgi:hypothetical protein